MNTLLLIGIQTDMMTGGASEVPGSEEVIPVINDLLPHYERVVAANFSLPADHLSFASNHPWRKPGQQIQVNGQTTGLQIMYCVQGSFGAATAPGLRSEYIHHTVHLGAEADALPHSAFFDTGNPRSTKLKEYLLGVGCTGLHLCGMPFETTVLQTALDARNLGFVTTVLEKACRSHTEAGHRDAAQQLSKLGILQP